MCTGLDFDTTAYGNLGNPIPSWAKFWQRRRKSYSQPKLFFSGSSTWGREKAACFSLACKPAACRGTWAVCICCLAHQDRAQGKRQYPNLHGYPQETQLWDKRSWYKCNPKTLCPLNTLCNHTPQEERSLLRCARRQPLKGNLLQTVFTRRISETFEACWRTEESFAL